MILCLEAMIWQTYYKRAPGLRFNVVKLTAWAVVVMGLFSILAVRLHYTLVRAQTGDYDFSVCEMRRHSIVDSSHFSSGTLRAGRHSRRLLLHHRVVGVPPHRTRHRRRSPL